jgi:hypothetical protein
MGIGNKIESTLEMLADEAFDIISSNLDFSCDLIDKLDLLSDLKHPFGLIKKDPKKYLIPVINASLMSDVFQTLVSALLSDDSLDDDELEIAYEALSKSLHRYCWREHYDSFKYATDGDDIKQLLSKWQGDDSYFGGGLRKRRYANPIQ